MWNSFGTSGITINVTVLECILPCFSVSGTLCTLINYGRTLLLMDSGLVLQMLIHILAIDFEHSMLAALPNC